MSTFKEFLTEQETEGGVKMVAYHQKMKTTAPLPAEYAVTNYGADGEVPVNDTEIEIEIDEEDLELTPDEEDELHEDTLAALRQIAEKNEEAARAVAFYEKLEGEEKIIYEQMLTHSEASVALAMKIAGAR